jgi:membrane protease subunit (stomatin/prohibitin family)
MGIMDKIKGELVDIIEWIDDSRSTLAWRFPRYHNEIKNGAELIVREGQEAVFVYRGALADRFSPGHYALTSENLPILGTLQGWKHGFNSPFRSEVYFINTRPVTDLRWGTPQPVTVRDPDFKMVQVRANGLCVVKIEDAEVFLKRGDRHRLQRGHRGDHRAAAPGDHPGLLRSWCWRPGWAPSTSRAARSSCRPSCATS